MIILFAFHINHFHNLQEFGKYLIERSDFIKKIYIHDKLYPKQLKTIPNPPQSLYLEGNIDLLNRPMIAIIGSRSCTKNGRLLAQKFSYELSQCGITIISGLAKRY